MTDISIDTDTNNELIQEQTTQDTLDTQDKELNTDTTDTNVLLSQSNKQIRKLIRQYKNNSFILSKLDKYIQKDLPNYLDGIQKRIERQEYLTKRSKEFIQEFMNTHLYSYCPYSQLYIIYDGIHFRQYREDNLHYHILSSITNERKLLPRKHKINLHLLKQIKERNPLSIPLQPQTLHYIIQELYPSIFPTRNMAKYFLTILGDIILQKQSQSSPIVYLIPSKLKKFLHEIEQEYISYFGPNTLFSSLFKYKYYDNDYTHCRLVIVSTHATIDIPHSLMNDMLDLFCVATYYSRKYSSSDNYLHTLNEPSMVQTIQYLSSLQSNTQLLNTFYLHLFKTIQNTPPEQIHPQLPSQLTNIEYIHQQWKEFLDKHNIPNSPNIISLDNVFQFIQTEIQK
jgi:hypothetical protein